MRNVFVLIGLVFQSFSFAQNAGPTPITPQMLENIKAEVEKEVPLFKQNLSKAGFTNNQIEFSVDTFRIMHLLTKRMNIDYSTAGMNKTVEEMAIAYGKLMNKYYDKLLKVLKPEDKQTLISAQQNWQVYRNAEHKLIWVMAKDAYSDGGTMQSNMATADCADLDVQRAIEIFNYFDYIIKDK
jgi:uncharacterized protein YecT (DUF1311 family)